MGTREEGGPAWQPSESSPGVPPVYPPASPYPGHPGPPPHQGYPPHPGYPPPVPIRGTDGFATTGLVLALLGVAPLGFIFSALALRRIKRSPARGQGLAIAGLAISSIALLFMAAALVVFLVTMPERDAAGRVTGGGLAGIDDVRVGDCLEKIDDDQLVDELQLLPCDEPHQAELAVVFDLTGEDYPGETTVSRDAEDGCTDRLEPELLAQIAEDEVDLYYLAPSRPTWRAGDREVLCFLTSDTPVTGSLRRGVTG